MTEAVAYNLTHPTLHQSLTTYMYMIGTSGYFPYSEPLEKQIRNMNLYINTEEDSCYTDFVGVYLGLKFPYFKNEIDFDFVRAKGIIGHEVGHLRFTSKKVWNSFVNRVVGIYKKSAVLARDLLNITEDYRIEYHMAIVSKFLEEQFFLLSQEMAEKIQKEFDEIDFSEEVPNFMKLNIIRNAVLYMRNTHLLPTVDNEEIMDYLKQIYPFVLVCRKAKSTKDAVRVTEKIMEIIKPLIDEHNSNGESRLGDMFDKKSKGSDSPVEGDKLEELQKQVKEFEARKKTAKKDKEKDEKKEEALIPEEVEKALDKIAEKAMKELSSSSEDKDKHKDKDDKEGNDEKEKVKQKTLLDYVEDLASKIDKYKEKIKKNVETKKEEIRKEIEENAVTNEMIGNFLKSTTKTKEQELREFNEEKNIKELKPLFDISLHQHCKPMFRKRHEMNKFSMVEYMRLSSQFSDIISRTAKELLDLSERKWQSVLRMQRTGRLDRRGLIGAAAFNDEKVFKKKQLHKEKLKMDFMIFFDNSGSNRIQILNKKNDSNLYRFQMNQIAAIFLHETLKKAKLQHTVWNFHEGRSYDEWFSPMIDLANSLEADSGLFLKDIGAEGGNRDGYSIAYAGDYLAKHGKADKKLLIVVSDGQPAGKGYGGPKALSDVKGTVEHLEKRGVKTIGIFTGHEDENVYFSQMYRSHLFLNNESIYKFPEELKNIIVREFQQYLMSF